jgi:uncharacterized protein YigA (DUF484 family)
MSPVTQAAAEDATPAAPIAEPAAEPADPTPNPGASLPAFQASPAVLDDEMIADWLHANPDFFDRHADVLSEVKLRQPHGGRAISLVERQVLVLRERNKALESRMAELIRIGQDNDGIGRRLQQLTADLLQATDAARLPSLLVAGLQHGFAVPQVAIRLWGIDGVDAPFGEEVSPEIRRRIDELAKPYCGPNSYPEAAAWLPAGGESTASMAMLALRRPSAPERATQGPQPLVATVGDAFGLVVLGSDDAARFQAGMGTAFLERIAEIASASLSRLLP